ncbi:LysR family transcriptional regulator [Pseudoalteromonas sp. Of7M-16]|uniref:LysR family transcriptional regulator n=1 Tax=Pseudoalteromonas sp. Of7M-16 TaxID=2917756 RepID=UPI001EF5702C|nr:LysR family transcriptional regulator [Pseudoalteromonas sp. Of7M-16]MCG7547704.1 LysR family transcriptional regulator [Pseudoalteromonas sp. Of7M-16]
MNLFKSMLVFQKVCELGSFSQAADQLNLVTSAVSRQVNELEKHFGVRLLQRTTRSVTLTADGRQYLTKISEITDSVQALEAIHKDDVVYRDHIQLTVPPILSKMVLTPLYNSLLKKHPEISISITQINRTINLVEEGYDFAIRVGHLEDSNLVARSISELKLALVASPEYLNTHGKLNHPKELMQHNCLINTMLTHPKRWSFKEHKRSFTVKVDGQYDVNDDSALCEMARAGLGIAYLPLQIVDAHLSTGELVQVLSDFTVEPLPISLVYPNRQLLSPAKRKLIEYLTDAFS